MNAIKQTYLISAPPAAVWQALTDPVTMREWSGAPVEFPLEVGAVYSLWDGSIGGEILEIVHERRLKQTWKPADWERQDSVVTFTLAPWDNGTRVELVHENVEERDYEGTDEGWDLYYLGAIKQMLEAAAPSKRAVRKSPAKKAAVKKTAGRTPKKKAPVKKKTVKKKPARRK